MASSCKGVSDPPNYESRYSVMDEDFSLSLHILDKNRKGTVCKGSVSASSTSSYLVLMKKDERKKEEKESEEYRPDWAFRRIMERLVGKVLEQSEGTIASLSEEVS